jgi:hypothetical protein
LCVSTITTTPRFTTTMRCATEQKLGVTCTLPGSEAPALELFVRIWVAAPQSFCMQARYDSHVGIGQFKIKDV